MGKKLRDAPLAESRRGYIPSFQCSQRAIITMLLDAVEEELDLEFSSLADTVFCLFFNPKLSLATGPRRKSRPHQTLN